MNDNIDSKQVSDSEKKLIFSLFDIHLITIGVLSFSLRIKGYKRIFLISSLSLISYFVFFCGYSVLLFALVVVPFILFWLLYILDLNLMVERLIVIQKNLVEEHNVIRELNVLLDLLQEYAKETNFFGFSKR